MVCPPFREVPVALPEKRRHRKGERLALEIAEKGVATTTSKIEVAAGRGKRDSLIRAAAGSAVFRWTNRSFRGLCPATAISG